MSESIPAYDSDHTDGVAIRFGSTPPTSRAREPILSGLEWPTILVLHPRMLPGVPILKNTQQADRHHEGMTKLRHKSDRIGSASKNDVSFASDPFDRGRLAVGNSVVVGLACYLSNISKYI
jgi:hypothetical protein